MSGAPSSDTVASRRLTALLSGFAGCAAALAGLAYGLAVDPRGHGRAIALVALAQLLVCTVLIARAPRLGQGRVTRWVLGYGTLVTAGSAAITALSGGIASPPALFLAGPLVVVAASLRRWRAVGVGALTVAPFAVIALTMDNGPPGYVESVGIGLLGLAVACGLRNESLASDRRALKRLARVDGLTGALNRRGFEERLRLACAAGRPFALLTFDLDGFKQVNDRLGHAAGDALLRWTAAAIAQQLRVDDVVGRLGGDEFGALVATADAGELGAIEARLVTALAALSPVSLGSARFPADGRSGDALQRHADRRLYEGKRAGARPALHPAVADPARLTAAGGAEPPEPEARADRRERARRTLLMCAGTNLFSYLATLLYLACTQSAPHRGTLVVLSLAGLGLAAALLLGARRVARARRGRAIGLLYSAVALAVMTAAIVLDGGPSSPFGPGILTPVLSAAMTLSPRNLLRFGAVIAADLGLIVGLSEPAPPGYVACLAFTMVGVAVMCSTQQRLAVSARRALARATRTDGLTNALNRRGVEERLAAELTHARRRGDRLVLLTIDLDRFKQVNDRHGHAAGDALLVWVTGRLAELGDHVGRLGGDEFTLLAPGCDGEAARALAERVTAELAERTPASVGYATFPDDGADAGALEAAADGRMYARKRAA